MPLALMPAWTEPVDLGILRESDDPLGFRSAANSIAGLLCSPITSRTTSVRHLSLFCWVANCASTQTGARINSEIFDRVARLMTIAASGALIDSSLALELEQRLSLAMPGRRKATLVAHRLANGTARGDDFDLPLLGSERAQGLWGSYSALARNLGLLEPRGVGMALSDEGLKLAMRFRKTVFPYKKKEHFLTEDPVEKGRICNELIAKFDSESWPLTPDERTHFLKLLDGERLGARPRLGFLMARAAHKASLASIRSDPEAMHLLGVDGESVARLVGRAIELNRLIRMVEMPFRTIYAEDAHPPEPDLHRFKELLEWADRHGLEMGALLGAPSTWHAINRHHTSIFHRRGRPSWRDLAAQGILHLPARPRLPDYRFSALRSLGRECELAGGFR